MTVRGPVGLVMAAVILGIPVASYQSPPAARLIPVAGDQHRWSLVTGDRKPGTDTPGTPDSNVRPVRPNGIIRGHVELRHPPADADARPNVSDLGMPLARAPTRRRRAVVYLDPAPRGAFDARDEPRARLDQRGEAFVPHVLAIVAGATVDFPNSDLTYHNVFSLSKTKLFDLGRYAAGRSRSIRFDRPGIVRVFCDIHSHMSAFILVFAHRYFAVTDDDGRYRLDPVSPGGYTVVVWNESAPLESRRAVVGEQGGDVEVNFTVGRR